MNQVSAFAIGEKTQLQLLPYHDDQDTASKQQKTNSDNTIWQEFRIFVERSQAILLIDYDKIQFCNCQLIYQLTL